MQADFMTDIDERPWPMPSRSECEWYHSMDFPDGESVVGEWDIRGRFDQYIGNYPIAGKTVLDVGTASGFVAFEAERRGATVTAIDARYSTEYDLLPFGGTLHHTDRPAWAASADHLWQRKGFWYAWHKFGSKVEMHYMPLAQLPFWGRRFDIVIAGAIVEHLANPIAIIADMAAIAKEAVILAFTPVEDSDAQTMRTANDWSNPAHNFTWWIPSRGIFLRVFDNVGFDVQFVISSAYHMGTHSERSRPTIIATRRNAER